MWGGSPGLSHPRHPRGKGAHGGGPVGCGGTGSCLVTAESRRHRPPPPAPSSPPCPAPRGQHVRAGPAMRRARARLTLRARPPASPPPPTPPAHPHSLHPHPHLLHLHPHHPPPPPHPPPGRACAIAAPPSPARPAPGCPSPTDSEVKRKVPSSMNTSWKPFSCPFMAARWAATGGRGKHRNNRTRAHPQQTERGPYLAASSYSLLAPPRCRAQPMASIIRTAGAGRQNHCSRGGGARYVTWSLGSTSGAARSAPSPAGHSPEVNLRPGRLLCPARRNAAGGH